MPGVKVIAIWSLLSSSYKPISNLFHHFLSMKRTSWNKWQKKYKTELLIYDISLIMVLRCFYIKIISVNDYIRPLRNMKEIVILLPCEKPILFS